MIKILYSSLLIIGAFASYYTSYYISNSYENTAIIALFVLLLVYRPLIDYVFTKKMNLYKGKSLWKKYPFYKFGNEILFGKIHK